MKKVRVVRLLLANECLIWFLMDFCQLSYRCGLLKVGKYDVMYPTYATPYAYYYALIEKLLLRDVVTVSEDGRPFQSSEGVISTMASSCQCSLWITIAMPAFPPSISFPSNATAVPLRNNRIARN